MIVPIASAAAPPPGRGDVGSLLLWLGVLIGVVVLLGLIVLVVRRRALAAERDAQSDRLLMESLRELRASGRMTEDEYAAARRTMAARISGRTLTPKPGAAPPPRHTEAPERDPHG